MKMKFRVIFLYFIFSDEALDSIWKNWGSEGTGVMRRPLVWPETLMAVAHSQSRQNKDLHESKLQTLLDLISSWPG